MTTISQNLVTAIPAFISYLDAAGNGAWKVLGEVHERQVEICRFDGVKLFLRIATGNKLEVMYVGDRTLDGRSVYAETQPFARFSCLRPIADIARDIIRQCLPGIDIYHASYQERLRLANIEIVARRDLRAELAQDLGIKHISENSSSLSATVNNCYISAQIDDSDSLDITLRRIPAGLAKQLIFSIKNFSA